MYSRIVNGYERHNGGSNRRRVKDQELGMEGRGRGWATAGTSGNHWKERGGGRERETVQNVGANLKY